jgi:hypothetical protein
VAIVREGDLREVLERLLDEFGCGGVGIGGSVELDRVVAAVVCGLGDVECFFEIDVELFAVVIDFAVFDVADVVGALEHGLDGAVVEVEVAVEDGVCEIGQGAQVGVIDGVDDFDDEEGVFAEGIVVFQGDHNVFLCSVSGHFAKAAGGALDIGGGVAGAGDVRTNAWGSDDNGYVHPLFRDFDRLFANGGIGVVETLPHMGGNVHDMHICFLQGLAEGIEIIGLGAEEVLGKRFDIVDTELGYHFGGELEQIHAWEFRFAIAIVGGVDVRAKRVGGDGDAVAWRGGEDDVGAGLAGCREEFWRSAGDEGAYGESREFFEEGASG